ncbi:acylphosphatase [Microbacterium sp. RD1]|uniref:acylphosphatase n=1 Tax=Microbacterium sp. RD1 TaxID=3457313 RepID=UPI003FA5E77A
MRRVHVRVRGRVQGVGYRYTAQARADELGLTGWVRNRADGTVEAEIEGSGDAVDAALAFLHEGPPGARVDEVVVTDVPAAGNPGFRVLPTA